MLRRMRRIASVICSNQWLDDGRDVHIYFDNDAQGHAPWNALTLADILGVTRKGRDKSEFTKRRTRGQGGSIR
jgi:hypothetical protein